MTQELDEVQAYILLRRWQGDHKDAVIRDHLTLEQLHSIAQAYFLERSYAIETLKLIFQLVEGESQTCANSKASVFVLTDSRLRPPYNLLQGTRNQRLLRCVGNTFNAGSPLAWRTLWHPLCWRISAPVALQSLLFSHRTVCPLAQLVNILKNSSTLCDITEH